MTSSDVLDDADNVVTGRPENIRAVPVRHPGRWVAIVVIAVLAAMLVHMLFTNTNLELAVRSASTCSATSSCAACG